MLLRLAYLTVTNTFDVLRLFPMRDRDKDIEILALRHQLGVLERQLGDEKVRFTPADRAFLATLLHRLPRAALGRPRAAFLRSQAEALLACDFFAALVGAEYCVRSRDLGVFVDEAAESVSSDDRDVGVDGVR